MDITNLFSLKGKNAVITGASGALGGAAVRAMLGAGASVAACYNNSKERLDALLADMGEAARAVKTYRVDSFNQEAIARHAEEVVRDFDRIDVVINTAGGNVKGAYYADGGNLFDLGLQPQFDTVVLNLFGGCFWPCLAYGATMLHNSEGGSIINFSSISAFTAVRGHVAYGAAKAGVSSFTQSLAAHVARDFNAGQANYAASKAGVIGLTKSIARELAARNVTANAVAPGFFPNNNPAQMLFNPDGTYRPKAQRAVDATPMRRMGNPEELMGTLIWLASDASSYVTGQTIVVDGGYLLDSPA